MHRHRHANSGSRHQQLSASLKLLNCRKAIAAAAKGKKQPSEASKAQHLQQQQQQNRDSNSRHQPRQPSRPSVEPSDSTPNTNSTLPRHSTAKIGHAQQARSSPRNVRQPGSQPTPEVQANSAAYAGSASGRAAQSRWKRGAAKTGTSSARPSGAAETATTRHVHPETLVGSTQHFQHRDRTNIAQHIDKAQHAQHNARAQHAQRSDRTQLVQHDGGAQRAQHGGSMHDEQHRDRTQHNRHGANSCFSCDVPVEDTLANAAWQAVLRLKQACEQQGIDYWLRGVAAAIIQGVTVPEWSTLLPAPGSITQQQAQLPQQPQQLQQAQHAHSPQQQHQAEQQQHQQQVQQLQQQAQDLQQQVQQPQQVLLPMNADKLEPSSFMCLPGPHVLQLSVQFDALPSLATSLQGQGLTVSPVTTFPGGSLFLCDIPLRHPSTPSQSHSCQTQPSQSHSPHKHHSHSSQTDSSQSHSVHNKMSHLSQHRYVVRVVVSAEQGTVVAAEPHRVVARVMVTKQHHTPGAVTSGVRGSSVCEEVWVESLWAVRRAAETECMSGVLRYASRLDLQCQQQQQDELLQQQRQHGRDQQQHVQWQHAGDEQPEGGPVRHAACSALVHAITARLDQLQQQLSTSNSAAWAEQDTYAAWLQRFGSPQEFAAWIIKDPYARLGSTLVRSLQSCQHAANTSSSKSSQLSAITSTPTPSSQPSSHARAAQQTLEAKIGIPTDAVTSRPAEGSYAPLAGLRITNLLGSHGLKALAMACLGAHTVTVVDVSPGNARYAQEAAQAAGLPLQYIVADVLRLHENVPKPRQQACGSDHKHALPQHGRQQEGQQLWGTQDCVVMENGILHYFMDLQALLCVVYDLLAPGGHLVLKDFHPISTKLVKLKPGSKQLKVSGNYFDAQLQPSDAAFTKHQPVDGATTAAGQTPSRGGPSSHQLGPAAGGDVAGVLLRRWSLGEVVTAVATSGLIIISLDEEPGPRAADRVVPKTFTLVACKPS